MMKMLGKLSEAESIFFRGVSQPMKKLQRSSNTWVRSKDRLAMGFFGKVDR